MSSNDPSDYSNPDKLPNIDEFERVDGFPVHFWNAEQDGHLLAFSLFGFGPDQIAECIQEEHMFTPPHPWQVSDIKKRLDYIQSRSLNGAYGRRVRKVAWNLVRNPWLLSPEHGRDFERKDVVLHSAMFTDDVRNGESRVARRKYDGFKRYCQEKGLPHPGYIRNRDYFEADVKTADSALRPNEAEAVYVAVHFFNLVDPGNATIQFPEEGKELTKLYHMMSKFFPIASAGSKDKARSGLDVRNLIADYWDDVRNMPSIDAKSQHYLQYTARLQRALPGLEAYRDEFFRTHPERRPSGYALRPNEAEAMYLAVHFFDLVDADKHLSDPHDSNIVYPEDDAPGEGPLPKIYGEMAKIFPVAPKGTYGRVRSGADVRRLIINHWPAVRAMPHIDASSERYASRTEGLKQKLNDLAKVRDEFFVTYLPYKKDYVEGTT